MEAVELAVLTRWFRVSGYYSLPKRPVAPGCQAYRSRSLNP